MLAVNAPVELSCNAKEPFCIGLVKVMKPISDHKPGTCGYLEQYRHKCSSSMSRYICTKKMRATPNSFTMLNY